MAISSRFTRASWSPVDERDRGALTFWLPGQLMPASGRVQRSPGGLSGALVAPASEGSRTGDGTPVSDPYAYENDGTTLVDYRPYAVSGVVKGVSALGFLPSPRGPGVGNFVDDPNTGVNSQAPNVPGKMMVGSFQENDYGLLPEVNQPHQIVVIFKWFDGSSGFAPMFEINGPPGSGVSVPDTSLLVAPLRFTKVNSGGGADTTLRALSSQPPVGQWAGVLWSMEPGRIRAYSLLTGNELPTTDPFPASGTYTYPPNTETGLTVVQSAGGRRYSSVGVTADRLRQRDFAHCHIQEIQAFSRTVDPLQISRYIRKVYEGIEEVLYQ